MNSSKTRTATRRALAFQARLPVLEASLRSLVRMAAGKVEEIDRLRAADGCPAYPSQLEGRKKARRRPHPPKGAA